MKVIGERQGGFIVDLEKDELAQLMGFSCEYYVKDKGIKLAVGSVLQVGDVFKRAMEALALEEEARKAAAQLKNTAMKFLSFYDKAE